MSNDTRRNVRWSLIVLCLVSPLELFLVAILATGPKDVVRDWTERMSESEKNAAALRISQYPLESRARILGAVTPERRAAAWRGVIDRFRERTPGLSNGQRDAILAARAFATTTFFENPTTEQRATLRGLAHDVEQLLGGEVRRELFNTAGPVVRSNRALPLRVQLEALLHDAFVTYAFNSCNCHAGEDGQNCSGSTPLCSEGVGCDFSYFGCGLWYQSTCNGYCMPDLH